MPMQFDTILLKSLWLYYALFWTILMKKAAICDLSKNDHLFWGCSLVDSFHKGILLNETELSTLSISSVTLDLTLLLFPRSCHNLRGEACPLRVKRKLVIVVAKVEFFFASFIHISTTKKHFEKHLCWESFHHLLWT